MALATVYETLAFFIPDSLFYGYALFSYQASGGLTGGFIAAAIDVGTLVDLAWIPVAISLVLATRKAFKTEFLE